MYCCKGHPHEFMLRLVGLVGQWKRIQAELPDDWAEVRLAFRPAGDSDAAKAAELLGPLTPGRVGREFRFSAVRRGSGASPVAVERALARLDAEGVRGAVSLLATAESPGLEDARRQHALAESWDELLASLPPDWSDLYVEVELTSSDHLDPAALALAPVNPARHGNEVGFRFRCARQFGYGAAQEMVRRCLARLDERGIPGQVRILRVLSDTKPVGTQGPVWYVGGKVI
jgi:hypothetical protein